MSDIPKTVAWPTTFTESEKARARFLVSPQRAPTNTGSTPIWPLVIRDVANVGGEMRVIADMLARDEHVRAKYPAPLTADNDRDHLVDAYQEFLDGCAYLRAALESPGADPRLRVLYDGQLTMARALRRLIEHRDGER